MAEQAGSVSALLSAAAPQSDEELLARLRAGATGARDDLIDRFGPMIERLVVRVLGSSLDLEDVVHEVFIRILGSVTTVRNPEMLAAWISRVTVFTVRDHLRRRQRTRWLWFLPNEELPEPEPDVVEGMAGEDLEAVRATYAVLDRLEPNLRLVFALRVFAELRWDDIAAACGISIATAKRRAARAEDTFVTLAKNHPALSEWVAHGTRWGKT